MKYISENNFSGINELIPTDPHDTLPNYIALWDPITCHKHNRGACYYQQAMEVKQPS